MAAKKRKPTVLLANHSAEAMLEVKNRLRRSGLSVHLTFNLVDTLACIRESNPEVVVIKPSTEPVSRFELAPLDETAVRLNKTLLVLKAPPDLGKLGPYASMVDDFFLGDSPEELKLRIELALRRIHEAQEVRRKVASLQEQSTTDFKTGIYNDRYILLRLMEEFQRADRHNLAISVILVDLDEFKTMNDTMGHPFGDFLLQAFSKHLSSLIRKIDIPGRYGGDEFLVLLPNTGLDEATVIANRIRTFLQNHTFKKGNQRARITVSQGINTYSGDGRINCDQFLQGADKAVLEAKRRGKNRVCLYPLMEEEEEN